MNDVQTSTEDIRSKSNNTTRNADDRVLTIPSASNSREISDRLQSVGISLIRYGLALVIAWIGAMKFTAYEANAIQPLVANSPLLSWVYAIFSVQAFAGLLGTAEIGVAAMIAASRLSAKVSALGSGLAALMLLGTLSFLLSTPGWEPSLGGFPALSVVPGQFLIKDVVLLGAAIWTLGESLKSVNRNR